MRKKTNNERVRIMKYVKLNTKWRFCAPVFDASGNLTAQVIVAGKPEAHPEGRFFIEWRANGKRKALAIERPEDVIAEAQRKHNELQAMKSGLSVINPNDTDKRTLHGAASEWLGGIKVNHPIKTFWAYERTVQALFIPTCTKTYISEVNRGDILAFVRYLQHKGYSANSIRPRVNIVKCFLGKYGNRIQLERGDRPKTVEHLVQTFDQATIEALLIQASKEDAMLFRFLLASGFRDAEAMHVTWHDVNFVHQTVAVKEKPLWGFQPKNWEERAVPLPTSFILKLKAWMEDLGAKPTDLLFPTPKGNPDENLDRKLKQVAWEAELNCGQCKTRFGNLCATGPHCGHFHLHVFRHTFAVEHLRSGMDIKEVQVIMGHKKTETTMIYLRSYKPKALHDKVNKSSIAALVS